MHRYVTDEPRIPFDLDVIYEDAGIIVVDKPHFLATTPRGMWYRETALIRLREAYGDDSIVPAHRLDRMTAGIVVFVRDRALRGAYQTMFQERRTGKVYECLAPAAPATLPRYGTVERLEAPRTFPLRRRSRIVKRRGILQAYEEPGEVNAETTIELGEWSAGGGHAAVADGAGPARTAGRVRAYTLHPRTGKTHQLRVHMNALGLPIVGDDLYPRIETRAYDDFSRPLELVARRLAFTDPVSGEEREFVSRIPLGGA
ncbi:pseudouridine synthase [Bifidobacterium samirii]|nr:pseudouridine synthase [Bifidobacterium samirii]